MRMLHVLLLAPAIALAGCATPGQADRATPGLAANTTRPASVAGATPGVIAGSLAATLPPPVRHALACAGLPPESLALMVAPFAAPGEGPRPTLSHQPDRPMQPASTMKVLTSVIGLDRVGPNVRGRTEVLTAAPLTAGRLEGDLVLRGGADPELSLAAVWQMLQDLRWQGVQEIAGDVVLDRSLFSPARPDVGVEPFDDAPEFPYNVIPDALQFTGQLMGLELRSDASAVHARPLPPVDGVTVDTSALRLDDRPCARWEDGWAVPRAEQSPDGQVRIALQGSFPRQCQQRPALQLFDRDLQAERQLRWLWKELGGRWQGRVRDGVALPGARLLVRHESRPWGELLRPLNKYSDNVLARLLYLSIGRTAAETMPAASSAERSEAEVRRWLAGQGIDATGLVVDNGSGLSRRERLTPRQLVSLLRVGLQGPHAPELRMSLPVAGVDGTMRNRLKDSVAAHRARLKTGGLRNVAALAGVVPDGQQREWLVAALLNDDALAGNGAGGRRVLDALIDWVARHGLAPEAWEDRPEAAAAACR